MIFFSTLLFRVPDCKKRLTNPENINQSQYPRPHIWQCQNLTDFWTRHGATIRPVVSKECQNSMILIVT